MPQFNDKTIEEIFGIEDAENEKPQRLKQYFFRNKAYENLVVGLPIRVLVGHKGIGKSALLKMAFLEDQENGVLALWLRPDDIDNITSNETTDLNVLIRQWKTGIVNVIFRKIIETMHPGDPDGSVERIKGTLSSLLIAVSKYFEKHHGEIYGSGTGKVVETFRKENIIHVYLDDLDRGWEAHRKDILKISALLNAIRDICGSETNLQFRLGLRSDVYFLVRTSDESTDKIERNIIWMTWDNHEILTVIAKRIETYFGRDVDEQDLLRMPQGRVAAYLDPVIVGRFSGKGHWADRPIRNVLLSLTRKRPRDLVKLFWGAARQAYMNGNEIIQSSDLERAFEPYSNERLDDAINEFKSELPDIRALLYGMRSTTRDKRAADEFLYSNDRLITKLKNLIDQNSFRFTNNYAVTAKSLAEFLYKIDFITARKDTDEYIIRRFFDQSRHLQNQFVDFGFHWEVHPAYRWALQPEDIAAVFRRLELEENDVRRR